MKCTICEIKDAKHKTTGMIKIYYCDDCVVGAKQMGFKTVGLGNNDKKSTKAL